MARKRQKTRNSRGYTPLEAKMGFSGVRKSDVPKLVADLKQQGAKEIRVQLDDGDYTGHPPGPYYVIDFRHGRRRTKPIDSESSSP